MMKEPTEDELNDWLERWTIERPLPKGFKGLVWSRVAARQAMPHGGGVFGWWLERIAGWGRPAVAYGIVLSMMLIGAGVGWRVAREESTRFHSVMSELYLGMLDPGRAGHREFAHER